MARTWPRQLALRCAATGILVVVATARPSAWEAVARAGRVADAPAGDGRVLLRGPQPEQLPPADEEHPQLLLIDAGPGGSVAPPPATPWRSTAVLVANLGVAWAEGVTVLARRLTPDEALTAQRHWQLDAARAHTLTSMADDDAVVFGPRLWQPLRLVTAPAETSVLGAGPG